MKVLDNLQIASVCGGVLIQSDRHVDDLRYLIYERSIDTFFERRDASINFWTEYAYRNQFSGTVWGNW